MTHKADQSVHRPPARNLPLELDLVFQVTSCRACSFFWPSNDGAQPYGPYTAYDFTSDIPAAHSAHDGPWISARTVRPTFPSPEIMDGCRKAPIMTIGINPNLTAFAPGRLGTSWCYPSFSSDERTDAFAKSAYYYRYRSIAQERLALDYVTEFALTDGQVTADADGSVVSALRNDDSPSYTLVVRYAGNARDTTLELSGKAGDAPYMLFVDVTPPHNQFKRHDLLAAKVAVPEGRQVEIFRQEIAYYTRFLTPLQHLEHLLKKRGHADASLHIGEDVGQLDMVACASPHWGPPWLGGANDDVLTIMHNCVSQNAWALKQFLHSQPALLVLVGQASYDMFCFAFGHLLHPAPKAPDKPEDGAFTLLRATCDADNPCTFAFSTDIDGRLFSISTRVVVAPHFSYATNYLPQYRLNSEAWKDFSTRFEACARFLRAQTQVTIEGPAQAGDFAAIRFDGDSSGLRSAIERRWPDAARILEAAFYDPNAMLGKLLGRMYDDGTLSYVEATANHPGYLRRASGPCSFCENQLWTLPQGCPYGKPQEAQYPSGFLESVADKLIASGAAWRSTNRNFAERAVFDSPFRGFPDPTV